MIEKNRKKYLLQFSSSRYNRKQCLFKSLEADPDYAYGWDSFGLIVGGGEINGKIYTKIECFVKALEIDPSYADAWFNLGMEGGGMVSGVEYGEVEAFKEALELKPDNEMFREYLDQAVRKRTDGEINQENKKSNKNKNLKKQIVNRKQETNSLLTKEQEREQERRTIAINSALERMREHAIKNSFSCGRGGVVGCVTLHVVQMFVVIAMEES